MTKFDFTDQVRNKVLSTISLSFFFIISFLAIFNVTYYSQYTLAFIELIYALLSLYIYLESKKGTCSNNIVFLYLAYAAFLIFLALYTLPFTDVLFLWGLFFPGVSYFLVGIKLGFYLSSAVFVSLNASLIVILRLSDVFNLEPVMLNFVMSYLAIWCIAHFFELSRASANESLVQLAFTDVLTGVNNRLAFTEKFGNYQGQFLLMLDLDNFKSINDQYGHDVGDSALRHVSDGLSSKIERNRIYRIGGEEFCLWIPARSLNEATDNADALRQYIAELDFRAVDEPFSVTFSGSVVEHKPGSTQSELLKQADELLYKVKDQGKNKVLSMLQ